MKTYSFEDGKYEIDRHEDYGTILDIRRHGEHWEVAYEDFRFSKSMHAMLNHIDQLENKMTKTEIIAKIEDLFEELRANECDSWYNRSTITSREDSYEYTRYSKLNIEQEELIVALEKAI